MTLGPSGTWRRPVSLQPASPSLFSLHLTVTLCVGAAGADRAAALGVIDPSFPRDLCSLIC